MEKRKFWFESESGRTDVMEFDQSAAFMEHLEGLQAEWNEPVEASVLVPLARASCVGLSLNRALVVGQSSIRDFLGIPRGTAKHEPAAPEPVHTQPEPRESVYDSIHYAMKRRRKPVNMTQLEIGGY